MFTITRLDVPGDEREPDITAANVDEVVDALEGQHGMFQITHGDKRASLLMQGQPRGDKFVVEIYRLVEALTAPPEERRTAGFEFEIHRLVDRMQARDEQHCRELLANLPTPGKYQISRGDRSYVLTSEGTDVSDMGNLILDHLMGREPPYNPPTP